MAKRKPNPAAELLEMRQYLHDRYKHYKELYHEGCSDPSYCDGTNINLVCNHIKYAKSRIEEICGENYFMYPDEYFWPDPKKVPDSYMAKSRKLNCRGEVREATEPRPFTISW